MNRVAHARVSNNVAVAKSAPADGNKTNLKSPTSSSEKTDSHVVVVVVVFSSMLFFPSYLFREILAKSRCRNDTENRRHHEKPNATFNAHLNGEKALDAFPDFKKHVC